MCVNIPLYYNDYLYNPFKLQPKGTNHFLYKGGNLAFLDALPQAPRSAEKCNNENM